MPPGCGRTSTAGPGRGACGPVLRAQTQRSPEHFNIGHDRMPTEVYRAYGYVKRAAAGGQHHAGRLPAWKGQLIERVCA